MPRFEASNWALAMTSSSSNRPMAANTGAVWPELTVGLALCAATHMRHEVDSVCLGWLWVDSAAAVHNIRDRQSHVDHRNQRRINFPLRIRLYLAYKGYPPQGKVNQVTIDAGLLEGLRTGRRAKRNHFNT
jgi:hypothetical protein